LKLLVDNNLSPSLAYSLQPLFLEHQIIALREKFAPTPKTLIGLRHSTLRAGGQCSPVNDASRRDRMSARPRPIEDRLFLSDWLVAEIFRA